MQVPIARVTRRDGATEYAADTPISFDATIYQAAETPAGLHCRGFGTLERPNRDDLVFDQGAALVAQAAYAEEVQRYSGGMWQGYIRYGHNEGGDRYGHTESGAGTGPSFAVDSIGGITGWGPGEFTDRVGQTYPGLLLDFTIPYSEVFACEKVRNGLARCLSVRGNIARTAPDPVFTGCTRVYLRDIREYSIVDLPGIQDTMFEVISQAAAGGAPPRLVTTGAMTPTNQAAQAAEGGAQMGNKPAGQTAQAASPEEAGGGAAPETPPGDVGAQAEDIKQDQEQIAAAIAPLSARLDVLEANIAKLLGMMAAVVSVEQTPAPPPAEVPPGEDLGEIAQAARVLSGANTDRLHRAGAAHADMAAHLGAMHQAAFPTGQCGVANCAMAAMAASAADGGQAAAPAPAADGGQAAAPAPAAQPVAQAAGASAVDPLAEARKEWAAEAAKMRADLAEARKAAVTAQAAVAAVAHAPEGGLQPTLGAIPPSAEPSLPDDIRKLRASRSPRADSTLGWSALDQLGGIRPRRVAG